MSPTPLRVVVADDHLLVREGTCRLLESTGSVDLVGSVGSPVELLEHVDRLRPDAVITDIRMPPEHRTEGIVAAHAIRARHPSIGVVVLSQYADPSYAAELLRHGSAGLAYLLKERVDDIDQLVRALHEVVAGRTALDPQVVEGLIGVRTRSAPSAIAGLSVRERDVLQSMAEGRSNGAIAAALHMSESAVEKHVSAIFTKLHLHPEAAVHRRVTAVVTYLRDLSTCPPPG